MACGFLNKSARVANRFEQNGTRTTDLTTHCFIIKTREEKINNRKDQHTTKNKI
jgi:hypothetical protein